MPVTREDVIWGFRMILGREPESEQAIAGHLGLPDRPALRHALLNSAESRRSRDHPENARSRLVTMGEGGIKETECLFYHTMIFPDESRVEGLWNILESFDEYIGRTPVSGKSLLDVGTASGAIAFECEKRGAQVTAHETNSHATIYRIPFAGSPYTEDHTKWVSISDKTLERLHRGFLYAHSKFGSKVKIVRCSLLALPETTDPSDIVIAGAIIQHVSDPVSAIGVLARLAKETLVLASTLFIESDDLFLRPVTSFSDPQVAFSWYAPSLGLLKQTLLNMNFRISQVTHPRMYDEKRESWVHRPTIVATRFK